eukprot:724201-Lingulodinium_polyedra.AAC.1
MRAGAGLREGRMQGNVCSGSSKGPSNLSKRQHGQHAGLPCEAGFRSPAVRQRQGASTSCPSTFADSVRCP